MAHLDKVAGVVCLALGILALAAVISTDAYSVGASVDASSYQAATQLIDNGGNTVSMSNSVFSAAQKNRAVTQ